MTAQSSHDKRLILDWPDRPAPSAADALWVERIEASRLAEAPALCPSCSSTVPAAPPDLKWCPECQQWRIRLTEFAREGKRYDGLQSRCRGCGAARSKTWRTQHALRGQLPLLEVISS